MDVIKFGETLSRLLPSIKTKLQLSGLAIALAFGLFVHFAKPGDTLALLTAGAVGISLVIFGQLFHFLTAFSQNERPKIFLLSFLIFCVFTLTLLVLTIVLVRKPSMSISQFDPSPENKFASHAAEPRQESATKRVTEAVQPPIDKTGALAGNDATLGAEEIVAMTSKDPPRNATYSFSMVNDIPTLKASLLYTVNSRKFFYPDADFHEDVSFGSPWLSLDIANPTSNAVLFTSLKTEALQIRLIDEVIPHVPDIENATSTEATLRIINEGWGKAHHPKLDLRYARPTAEGPYPNHDRFVIVGHATFTLDDFDEGSTVKLGSTLPPFQRWWHRKGFKPQGFCKTDGYLELLGRLQYTDEGGAARIETFRTHLMTCIGGGGNVFPSVAFNITLPTDPNDYPLYTPVANCIASNAADELVVKLTAKRSTHFRLKFTLTSTSGLAVERVADVDVLVPRFEYTSPYRDGAFFKAPNKNGCS